MRFSFDEVQSWARLPSVQVHPTRAAVDIALAGAVVVIAGTVLRQPAVLAWGGALLLGLALARGVTELGVTKIRAAGFEMLWHGTGHVLRLGRGEQLELTAELRNRDDRATRYVGLRALHSPELELALEPSAGEVPAGAKLRVSVSVRARRVGHHAIHGLSLEVQGAPGLFEVPLTFANPLGVEVSPAGAGAARRAPVGGRARSLAVSGRPSPRAGSGDSFRELREYLPGDPFKRIAWRASARRGALMVREYEHEQRDVVWLLLDGSSELWSGRPGTTALDHAVDEVYAVARRHLGSGDRVGLAVFGARVLDVLEPDAGAHQLGAITQALTGVTHGLDADRSDWDELDVALRVVEHLRPLAPSATRGLTGADLEAVAEQARAWLARAPFPELQPAAPTARERTLRRYLAAYGVGAPLRLEPERPRTDRRLAEALERLATGRPPPSIVYLWSPALDGAEREALRRAIERFPKRRTELRWLSMSWVDSIPLGAGLVGDVVARALITRARVAERRGVVALRRLGVRASRPPRRPPPEPST